MRIDLVKRETCRAHIRGAFGEDIEVLTDKRDERSLVRGRVGQRVNLQFAQYFAKFLISRQLRVRRGGRGEFAASATGAIAATGVPSEISTLLFEGFAIGTKNSELDGS